MSDETPRLTPTQRLHEVTMQALNRQPRDPECTVGLVRNAKGDVQIEVTARGADTGDTGKTAEKEFDRLCAKYPRAEASS